MSPSAEIAVPASGTCPGCRRTATTRWGHIRVCDACGTPFAEVLPRTGLELPPLEADAVLPPGTCLGERYRLEQPLGSGAHGITYLARHEYLNHPCVVKTLPFPAHFADQAARRLRAEASAGFRVSDPHVVRVIDCDSTKGWWYFVMEYVEGIDLAAANPGAVLPWQAVLRIAQDAARGLDAIHRARLLHRDIKPANLLLGTDGRVRIADLGVVELASAGGEEHGRWPTGTTAYAAPEILSRDQAPSAASDLYSLGATLYELAVGHPPRDGNPYRILLDSPSDLISWPDQSDAPPWLQTAILRLLAHHPHDRIASAAALRALLDPVAESFVAVPPRETVAPNGVVILPLENGGAAREEWWGQAIAEHVGRVLSRGAAEYVVDREQFEQTFARLDARHYPDANQRTLEAGRLTGAGTIVTGQYCVSAGQIECSLSALGAGTTSFASLGVFRAALEATQRMETEIAARIRIFARRSGELVAPGAGPSGPLAAQEPYFSGKRAFLRGDYPAARLLFQQALAADAEFADALGYAAICSLRVGAYDDALRYTDTLESLAEQRGDERLRVEAAANRGSMAYFRGQYAASAEQLSRAARAAERAGLRVELAQIRNNLGFALLQLGRVSEAEAIYRLSIETHQSLGALVWLIGPYNGLGHVLREQGRYDDAREYFARARALAQECDDRVNIGVAFMNLGQCALLQRRFDDAKGELAAALTLLEETRFWNGLGRVFEFMGDLALQTGRWSEAERCAAKRIELAARHANSRMEAEGWRQRGRAQRGAGRSSEALECESRARTLDGAAAA